MTKTEDVLCVGLSEYEADILYALIDHALCVVDDNNALSSQRDALRSVQKRIITAGR